MSFLRDIESGFRGAGARVKLGPIDERLAGHIPQPMSIDVVEDEVGEYFDVRRSREVVLAVVDVQPDDRHLVLSAWNSVGEDRFLCGHDEYHWFVAALPSETEIETVAAAKEALKPDLVKQLEHRRQRGRKHRRHDVFVRQGEWFFTACPHASVDLRRVVRDGVLVRGEGSKPHYCEFLYEDGEREYECSRYPKLAFFETEYRHLLRTRRKAKQWNWKQLTFQPDIFVKGWIRHVDHSPLFLDVWHQVTKNREAEDLSMSRLVYRD